MIFLVFNIILYLSANASKLTQQFAGLLEGNGIASMPVLARQYLLYRLYALLPVVKIALMEVCFNSVAISFGFSWQIDASLAPFI